MQINIILNFIILCYDFIYIDNKNYHLMGFTPSKYSSMLSLRRISQLNKLLIS